MATKRVGSVVLTRFNSERLVTDAPPEALFPVVKEWARRAKCRIVREEAPRSALLAQGGRRLLPTAPRDCAVMFEVRLEPESGGTHLLVTAYTMDDVPRLEPAFAGFLESLWCELDVVASA